MIKIFSPPLDPRRKAAIGRIKKWVSDLIKARPGTARDPAAQSSGYWAFFTDAFDYMSALPDEQMRRLRLHTYHIDGVTYLNAFFTFEEQFIACLNHLWRDLPERYRLAAPRACGEHGHVIDGRLVNEATFRWQKLVKSLHMGGVLDELSAQPRPVILEIGAGYGSLANYMSNIVPNALYVIVDLPETMLFSASYLSMVHGPDRVRLVSPGERLTPGAMDGVSFVLVPNFCLSMLSAFRFDLAINVMSFQEMTESQIRGYLAFVSKHATRFLSWNHDRNHFSGEMVSVPDLISKYFRSVKKLSAFEPPRAVMESMYHKPAAASAGRRLMNVFVFGAGMAGVSCARELRRSGQFRVQGFIDNAAAKRGPRAAGIGVFAPAHLRRRDWDYVFIASVFHRDIVVQLESLGYRELVDFAVYEPYDYPMKIRRYDLLARSIGDEHAGRHLASGGRYIDSASRSMLKQTVSAKRRVVKRGERSKIR